jgi:6-phosphofructokinase
MQKVDRFVIYQTIGRETGWLAAATALARKNEEDAPHLIYTPEFHFNREKFLNDVNNCIKANGWVSVVCGEGLKYSDGTPVGSATLKDEFNNIEYGAMGGSSVAINLHRMITEEFGFRGEFQITESLIMSDFIRSSAIDLEEAYCCGVEAIKLAEKGESGVMVSIIRISDKPYTIVFDKISLRDVTASVKQMPAEFFNSEGNHVSSLFIDYMKPLAGELPDFIRLEKIFAKTD